MKNELENINCEMEKEGVLNQSRTFKLYEEIALKTRIPNDFYSLHSPFLNKIINIL